MLQHVDAHKTRAPSSANRGRLTEQVETRGFARDPSNTQPDFCKAYMSHGMTERWRTEVCVRQGGEGLTERGLLTESLIERPRTWVLVLPLLLPHTISI